MEQGNNGAFSSKRMKVLKFILFIAVGLLINYIFSQIAIYFNLPLYIDNVGVMLTAALGGSIPAVIVGYATNLINGISNPVTVYYGTISVLIAVTAARCFKLGWFKKIKTTILSVILFALYGGVLGSILTWALYGFDFGSGVSAPLVHAIYNNVLPNAFMAQMTGDLLIDIIDKAITVAIVLIILKLIPEKLRDSLMLTSWRQKPLSRQEEAAVSGKTFQFRSLRSKITFIISAAMLIIVVITTCISFSLFHQETIDDQCSLGESILHIASDTIDADRIDEFLTEGEAAPGYVETENALNVLRNSTGNIEYIYVYRILEDGCHVVFDPDTEDLPGEDPGTVVEFDSAFSDYIPDLLAGREIKPVISDETYGWLLTLYKPLYDSSGKCAAYAAVDISMDHLRAVEYSYLGQVISLFLGIYIVILVIVLHVAKYGVILPINTMTRAAENFAFSSEESREDSVAHIRDIDIRTSDEIEDLYRAFTHTSEEMVRYVADVNQKNETISRMQSRLIEVMADMVESRDKYTGDHVRKTAAYSSIIMNELKKEGVYTDELTDTFIADVEQSAPLHDIGKIQVSDTILNKPGRLTDEEFDIMKGHTIAGSEIISSAADAVSESGYLDEAQRLAAYHHEKWNGQGYPYGISGEDIPLSARIMAVADVFDALVSKRSYKEGFPVEKAFDIIREGSGTHFDPVIVTAFLNAEEEVRRVAAENTARESADEKTE